MTRVMHPHFFVAKFRMLFATFTGCIFSPLQIFLQPLVHCMGLYKVELLLATL